jgi:hypothetical protein
VTGFGDDQDDMPIHRTLDDRTVEALLAGRAPRDRDDLTEVASLLAEARSIGEGPAPVPSPDLAVVLASGVPVELLEDTVEGSGPTQGRRRSSMIRAIPRSMAMKVAGLGLAAKVFLALMATAAVAAGAAAADLAETVSEAFDVDTREAPVTGASTASPSAAEGSGDPARQGGAAEPAVEQEPARSDRPAKDAVQDNPADEARTHGLIRAQEQTADTPARVPDEVGPGTNNGRPPEHPEQGPPEHVQQGPPDHVQQGPPDHAQQGPSAPPSAEAP